MKPKQALALLLALLLCLSLCACGNSSDSNRENDLPTHSLGESIETDILRITLTRAELAIKLNATSSGTYEQIQSGNTKLSEKYFTAEEYDPEKDAGLAYIAPKGHTYVAIEIKADNLDRASVGFDRPMLDENEFLKVEYGGTTYTEDTNYGCRSENGYSWERYDSSGVLLLAGEETYYRFYVDIPTEANDLLNDEFSLIFYLPKSDGTTEAFKYLITGEDRAALKEQEIPLETAIRHFADEDGQEYFTNHMDEYSILTGDEITATLISDQTTWTVSIKENGGRWEGGYCFESSGRIKETHSYLGTGYFNNKSWQLNEDKLVILKDGDAASAITLEVREVSDGVYLFVRDGAPYMLASK